MANTNGILKSIVNLVIGLVSNSRGKSASGNGSGSSGGSQPARPKSGSKPQATLNPQPHGDRGGSSQKTSQPQSTQRRDGDDSAGQYGDSRTIEIDPPAAGKLTITYSPNTDGDPDAGEVIWTWVPYEENDGRGKDRPVLVIGRQSADRVYVVRLTSKSHDGDRDFLSIGSGPWDSQGRPSWVDIDQVYTVHIGGMRRESSSLDLKRFSVVADALVKRYGWKVAGSK